MVDSVLAPRTQNASGVGGAERTRSRGPVDSARSTAGVGQRAFGASFADSAASLPPISNDQMARTGNGLLSTGVQILLAETRSQEAAAPFVAPSKVGQAINVYLETQGQVRDTIRANGGGLAAGSALTGGNIDSRDSGALEDESNVAVGALTGVAGAGTPTSSPIDSSIDDEPENPFNRLR